MNNEIKVIENSNKKTYTVNEIAQMLCIGRNAAYTLVKEDKFRTVMIGSTIRVSKKSFDEWLNSVE